MTDRTTDALEAIAALQAEQARQLEVLQQRLEGAAKRRRRRRRSPVYSPPRDQLCEPTDLERALARRLLRQHYR